VVRSGALYPPSTSSAVGLKLGEAAGPTVQNRGSAESTMHIRSARGIQRRRGKLPRDGFAPREYMRTVLRPNAKAVQPKHPVS
jgi:hypothetical protein